MSYPSRVPSLSIEVSRISPAPAVAPAAGVHVEARDDALGRHRGVPGKSRWRGADFLGSFISSEPSIPLRRASVETTRAWPGDGAWSSLLAAGPRPCPLPQNRSSEADG